MTGKRVALSALYEKVYVNDELPPEIETSHGKYRRADILPNVDFGRDLGDTLSQISDEPAWTHLNNVVIEHVVRYGPFDNVRDGMRYVVAKTTSPLPNRYQVGIYTRI